MPEIANHDRRAGHEREQRVRDRGRRAGRGEGRRDAAGEGFDGPVVLIGDETERPYERPPLSKDYLLGKAERETIFVHPQALVRATTRSSCASASPVTGIDRAAHEVTLADGSRVGYAEAAAGHRLRAAPAVACRAPTPTACTTCAGSATATRSGRPSLGVPGRGHRRRLDRAGGRPPRPARPVPRSPSLETAELPLLRVLGREVAQVFADLHREHGVDLRFGVGVERDHRDRRPGHRRAAGRRQPASKPTR